MVMLHLLEQMVELVLLVQEISAEMCGNGMKEFMAIILEG